LVPAPHATVRRALDHWFEATHVRPELVAEFDDSGLMHAFGEEGKGIFCVPTVFEKAFCARYKVQVVGRAKAIRQQFYAISVDRRLQNPAVAAIIKAARQEVFR
jgi:LysR family transcriptional activator of nhaA